MFGLVQIEGVMAGLVPAIHGFLFAAKTRMPATSADLTDLGS
jgi:hypothetical protein